jgi:glycosyltransferase involved in cell wall biosynthesis
MSVLYLTNKPVYPLVDGGCVAMSSFLNHLVNIHKKVDHLTISTYKHPFDLKSYNEIFGDKLTVSSVYVNTRISVFKAFENLFSSSSYNVNRFFSVDFENKLIELLEHDYEVIYIESIFLLPYLTTIRTYSKAKVILRAPNIEFKIWEDHILQIKNPLKKIYIKYLTKKLKNFELNQFKRVDGILSISNVDTFFIENLNLKKQILHLPFAIKTELIGNIEKNNFFFIGAYNWKPNLDAALYLIQVLFPEILKNNANAKLHIAGSYTPDFLYQYQNESIKIHGKVESVKDFMKSHGILLAPIFSGSGVRIKILEALSYGIPVIGSEIAIQGIHSKACFKAENIEDYLRYITTIFEGDVFEIQNKAIEYIDSNYHPTEIEKKLNAFIASC